MMWVARHPPACQGPAHRTCALPHHSPQSLPDDPAPPSREGRIAEALEALQRDLEDGAAADPSGDAELRRRLQDFADLFLKERTPLPPADL